MRTRRNWFIAGVATVCFVASCFIKINGAREVTFIKNDKGEVTVIIHHKAGLPDSEGKELKNE